MLKEVDKMEEINKKIMKKGRVAEVEVSDDYIVSHRVYICETEGQIIIYKTGVYYGADSLNFCIAQGHKVRILY